MKITPKVRMNRLFRNGGCLDVAVDHGVCNEPSFLNGLEDMPRVVEMLVGARPDAIQMTGSTMSAANNDKIPPVPARKRPMPKRSTTGMMSEYWASAGLHVNRAAAAVACSCRSMHTRR